MLFMSYPLFTNSVLNTHVHAHIMVYTGTTEESQTMKVRDQPCPGDEGEGITHMALYIFSFC